MLQTKKMQEDFPLDQKSVRIRAAYTAEESQILSFFLICSFFNFFSLKKIFHHCCRIVIPCNSLYVWVSA